MLRLTAEPTFTVPVSIPTPNGSMTVKMTFKHMTKDEYSSFIKGVNEKGLTDDQVLPKVISGWADIDADFSLENLNHLCQQYHKAASVIAQTYIEHLTGAKQGN